MCKALGKCHLKPMEDEMSSLIPTAIILPHMLRDASVESENKNLSSGFILLFWRMPS